MTFEEYYKDLIAEETDAVIIPQEYLEAKGDLVGKVVLEFWKSWEAFGEVCPAFPPEHPIRPVLVGTEECTDHPYLRKRGFYVKNPEEQGWIIESFKKFFGDNYTPSIDIEVLLKEALSLVVVFDFIPLKQISIQNLFKLEVAISKLILQVSDSSQTFADGAKYRKKVLPLKRKNAAKGDSTKQDVLDAYRDLGASYDEKADYPGEKPFEFNGKRFTHSRFATELKEEMGLVIQDRQIGRHLKKLIKEGLL